MKNHLSSLISVLLLGLLLLSLGCNNDGGGDDSSQDDSTDDDTGDDDTSSPDDDSGDDTGDDDTGDDDTGDDDTGDDDSAGPDPLAVIDCDASCLSLGEPLGVSGSGSSDPQGLPLDYSIDFGDGTVVTDVEAQHAYDASGAYQVVLTATNSAGASDVSSCIVSVGDFPTAPGTMNSIAFSPNYYDPRIIEFRSRPDHGGVIYGFFTVPFAATADTILLNGISGVPENGKIDWCEIINNELNAGDIGILRCHSYDADFDAGSPIQIEVKEGSTTIWSYSGTIPAQSLTPSYITTSYDGAAILVHVRNDTEENATVEGLSINGTDVTDFSIIHNSHLVPGGTAIIEVPRCDGVPYGEWMIFTVRGGTGKSEVADSRPLRLFEPIFPVGNWNSSHMPFEDADWRAQELSVGINMFIYYPLDGGALDPNLVFPMAESEDFYLFTHYGWPEPEWQDQLEQFFADWGGNPRFLADAVSGEGESDTDPLKAQDNIDKIRYYREILGGTTPTWSYNHCSYHFPSWGAMADISGFDRYCVGAAKCNWNWPIPYWDYIATLAWHAEVMKRSSEPRPIWNWTQSMWNDLDFELFGMPIDARCTTAEEIRAQWMILLARGTKGMLWFIYRDEWEADCPDESTQEMQRLATELRVVEDILIDGDTAAQGVVAGSDDELVDVSAVVAPHGMVVFLSNYDYKLNLLTPWEWNVHNEVAVDVIPPVGFEIGGVYLIDHENLAPLSWMQTAPGRYRFTLPEL